jgi:hypothetical protein
MSACSDSPAEGYGDRPLEPMVAHGARMSWAGLLRPGDSFCPTLRSRLATMTSEFGPPLKRYYGTWSAKYRRFCTNLSSPRIVVGVREPGDSPEEGIQCILHWVAREDMIRTDTGGVCHGDGWPTELWERFTARLDQLGSGSVGDKLRSYANSDVDSDIPIVEEWRALIQGRSPDTPSAEATIGEGWVPVPADLKTPARRRTCILSWSPSALRFQSLREALGSPEARARQLDLKNQAAYYLECQLARLHGVSFGSWDSIEDRWFEEAPQYGALADGYYALERGRIADPSKGRLDCLG